MFPSIKSTTWLPWEPKVTVANARHFLRKALIQALVKFHSLSTRFSVEERCGAIIVIAANGRICVEQFRLLR